MRVPLARPLGLTLATLLAAAAGPAASANIQCWTNRAGIFECSDRLPPEYAQERTDVRNRQGIVIDTREAAKTPAQIEREAQEAAAREQEQRRAARQAAHDRMLLSTYLDEADLQRAAERNLLSVDSIIGLLQRNVDSLEEQASQLERRRAQRAGRDSEALAEDLARNQRQLATAREQLAARQQERAALEARFEADLARYRELKRPPADRR